MIYIEAEDRGEHWHVRIGRRGRLAGVISECIVAKDRCGRYAQGAMGFAISGLEGLLDADSPLYQQPSQLTESPEPRS